MNKKSITLVVELLVNHLVHLRSQVDILQEKLDQAGVVSQDALEREVEANWTENGEKAVDAFWDEFTKLKREHE